MTGFAEQIELKGPWKWIGGFVSAGFGGLVGNQGGIRSAAMLGFDLSKESFVATAVIVRPSPAHLWRGPVFQFNERYSLPSFSLISADGCQN